MLTDRKNTILRRILSAYVRDARPIASQMLIDDDALDVSPATIRNDMLELEGEGYLHQPHTSAGRVPTEKSWRYALEHFWPARNVQKNEEHELRQRWRTSGASRPLALKQLAQALAELTDEAVFVAFSPRDTYYTGISKLFAQPEFQELDLIRDVSRLVDNLDRVMPDFYRRLDDEVTVLLGRDNPFSRECGLILSAVPRTQSLFGILGPLRQDYPGHIALVRFTRRLLTE